jgi:hypothetical protein
MRSTLVVIPADEYDQLVSMPAEKFKEQLGELVARYQF